MCATTAQPHGLPLPAAAADAHTSHAEHSHRQSSVQSTLHDCRPAAGWDGSTIALSENYLSETIGRSDCRPIVRLSADTIVRWDYRPNPTKLYRIIPQSLWLTIWNWSKCLMNVAYKNQIFLRCVRADLDLIMHAERFARIDPITRIIDYECNHCNS